ncbi:hypothetical protein KY285_019627 [Solanum tuberosum]|nr:hypothetical protein KY285_019627 [Solanum tuberosum]
MASISFEIFVAKDGKMQLQPNIAKEGNEALLWYYFFVMTGKTRGYGFVSFSNSLDRAAALTEMNGKYVGNRPIILRKSKSRTDYEALERRRASA